MARKSRVLVVREGYPHMGPHSGYGRIADFIPPQENMVIRTVWRVSNNLFYHIVFWVLERTKLLPLGTHFYKAPCLFTEIKVIIKCLFKKYDIIHYLSIDDNYCLLGLNWVRRLIGKKVKVIGTVHQPHTYWSVSENPELLKKLDLVIVLTQHELKAMGRLTDAPLTYLPHGVDSEFFTPQSQMPKFEIFTCLFIGSWLRDISLLRDIIRAAAQSNPSIQFKIVHPWARTSNDQRLYQISQSESVEFLHQLDDEELLSTYSRSHLLILPLIDCTANNAILEAMACGLPILTSDLPGVKSYISQGFSKVFSHDPHQYVQAILGEMSNPTLKGEGARARVLEEFSWPLVSKKLADLYTSLVAEQH